MKVLSFGAGMQSTALALMSCENAAAKKHGKKLPHPMVPIYDIVIYCNLGLEPIWVKNQADFVCRACNNAGISYEELDAPRNCTLDYKIQMILKYVRWVLLGYRKGQRLRDEDRKAHEMHLGFSFEEKKRCQENPNPMFVNKFPLVDMKLDRKDSYTYNREVWGLDTKASACCFCPFHRNFFCISETE